MKKNVKIIISVLLLVFVLLTATACDSEVDIGKLLEKDYNSLQVVVQTTQDMGTLTNTYKVSKVDGGNKVEYTCQKFATIDGYDIPDNRIESATGYIVVENGTQGAPVGDAPIGNIPQSTAVKLDLNKENMKDIVESEGKLSAKIVDASVFFKNTVDFTDVAVEIEYNADAISKIVISYKSGSAQVSITCTLGI